MDPAPSVPMVEMSPEFFRLLQANGTLPADLTPETFPEWQRQNPDFGHAMLSMVKAAKASTAARGPLPSPRGKQRKRRR